MKKLLLAIACLFSCISLWAQTHATFSTRLHTNSILQLSGEPIELANGDILAVGSVIDSILDTAITKAVMVRMDEHGNLLWSKKYSGGVFDRFLNQRLSNDSAIYAMGDTRSYGTGGDEWLISKLDFDGNVLWTRIFGGSTGNDDSRFMDVATNGDLLVTGMISGLGASSTNISLVRVDPQGNLVFRKFFGTNSADYAYMVKELNPNEILVAGSVFSPSPNMNFMAMTVDSLGNLIWARNYDNADTTAEWERFLGSHYQAGNGDHYFGIRCGGFGSNGWFDSLDIATLRIDNSGNHISTIRYTLPGQERNGSILPWQGGLAMILQSNTFDTIQQNINLWTDSSGVPTYAYVQNDSNWGISSFAVPSILGGFVGLGSSDSVGWVQHLDNDLNSCLPLGPTVTIPYVNQPMNMAVQSWVLADTGVFLPVVFSEVGVLQIQDSSFCYSCDLPVISYSETFSGDTVSFTSNIQGDYTTMGWSFGDGGTSTDLNPMHVYPGSGTYLACLTASNYCGIDSFCNTINILVSMDEVLKSGVKIYPNPSTGTFNLILPEETLEEKVLVKDAFGRIVGSHEVLKNDLIDLGGLPAGPYWLQFHSLGTVVPIHVVK